MKRQQWLIKYLMSSPHAGVSSWFVHGLPLKEGINSSQSPSIIGSIFFLEEIGILLGFSVTMPGSPYHVSQVSITVLAISEEPGWGTGPLWNWQQQITDQKKVVTAFGSLLLETLSWALTMLTEALAFLQSGGHSEQWRCWFDQGHGLPRYKLPAEISKKHELFLSLLSTSFPLLSLPSCWGLLILL